MHRTAKRPRHAENMPGPLPDGGGLLVGDQSSGGQRPIYMMNLTLRLSQSEKAVLVVKGLGS
jgi:hypothetical protein